MKLADVPAELFHTPKCVAVAQSPPEAAAKVIEPLFDVDPPEAAFQPPDVVYDLRAYPFVEDSSFVPVSPGSAVCNDTYYVASGLIR